MTSGTGFGMRRGTAMVAAGLLGLGLTAGCAQAKDPVAAPSSGSGAAAAVVPAAVPGATRSIPEVVAAIDASVVTVEVPGGVGSGVVYRDGGYVVTNRHVVGDAQTVNLELADGSKTPAKVLATDAETDLAVLKAERADLPPAPFQRTVPPVGSLVLAIGSPLGFQNSVTSGILSGVGREIPGAASAGGQALVDLLQTDAAISPGNSGGALLNAAGEVVGINEAYIPPSVGAVNLGFAIPATTVIDVVDQLIATGEAIHPYLGINGGTLNPATAQGLGVAADSGVVVAGVAPDSPAATAGLQAGDIVIGFNGEQIDSFEDLLGELRGVDPGDEVPVEVLRAGETLTVQVTIAEQPDRTVQ